MSNINSSILYRVRWAFVLVVLPSFAIVFRIGYLQTVRGEELRKLGREKILRREVVPATRGNIYASDEQGLMATSLPFYRMAIDPTVAHDTLFNGKVDSLAYLLSAHFADKSGNDYRRMLASARKEDRQYLLINNDYITFQDKKKMMKWPLIRSGRHKGGVYFEKTDKRYLPFKNLAQRTIGYVKDNRGATGLELSFNKYLAGVDGQSIFRKMPGGLMKPVFEEVLPADGSDIVTTIDVNIQDVAESALYNALLKTQADHGCVIVMETATGKIKAMANLGNDGKGDYSENFNYAIGNKTEPGSTMKLASYMALFEEGFVKPEDTVDSERGSFKFYERTMLDVNEKGYGRISLSDAFAKSSNVAISKLIFKHFKSKPDLFLKYLDQFGLHDNLQFQITGYQPPFIKTKDDNWSGTTLPWMSVGYEIEMTPLQTLAFYNAVANEGKMVKPIIVQAIKKGEKVIEEYEPVVMRDNICSDETLEMVKKMLEAVVEKGTAQNVKHADYKIAGKTGTAQKIIDGKYTKTYYTSFCGYFPAEKPKYSCIVIIDKPKGWAQYAAEVAAPVFKEIADKIFALDIEMHKELEDEKPVSNQVFPVIRGGYKPDLIWLCNKFGISNHQTKGSETGLFVKAVLSNNAVKWRNAAASGLVPDMLGMTLKDAIVAAERNGYSVVIKGSGRVNRQSPAPLTAYSRGNRVVIELDR